ncbi:hypothetical protein [Leptospira kirschneri]|uniref:hypothetical protein n=1 Tax=Leptospira kirschneri TaxID=29507 RepID=UPI000278498B|nr:hypothetical protein [Leptospira kirschneri]EJO69397.1 hypothetical protein LEP1GSC044_3194 [Leptospira kirschneri serovar Grippotyphosa str. RM52]EKP05920.1 hypothetical protein LEP1GSC018_2124 [Leptospira kirschneri str. 2008720114]EKQ83589.1 hypothetical protein LEP1GSC064_2502 [Leptospira kirschneri serovar Grippotyphosa str. Moskva]EKR09012.1 hypothetical protein LEP1GSC122_0617 [Leptospira kirschneri serovar Valbuzzi str. 200702274]EMJ95046.1 hypothetical protein LEP1GSC198_1427 [Lept
MIQVLVTIFSRSYIFLLRTSKNNSRNSKSITVRLIPHWILILLLFPKIILGITPGKWSHIDKYIFGNNSNGPVKEIVKNANGKIVYSAFYEYDSSGKLIKESYLNADGKTDGFTIFQYKDGKVVREELFDKDHILLETKTFRYNPKGEIDLVEVFDKDNKLLLRSNINSWDKDFVKSGQTSWPDSKEIEIFNLTQDEKNPRAFIQNIYNEEKKQIASTKFEYDEKGKLLTRLNVQGNQERKNQLNYSSNNLLQSFTFHVKQNNKWELQKIHELIYK